MTPGRHIVLLGPMASGKTTIGRLLGHALDVGFVDSDDLVAAAAEATAAEVAVSLGVAELHRVERDVLLGALGFLAPTVIAAAASVLDDPAVRLRLATQTCVGFDADPVARAERQARHRRPMDSAEQRRVDAARRPHLDALCLIVVDTTTTTPDQSLAAVVGALGAAGIP